MVLEKLSAGGQMALTSQIDNYPGFEEGIDGFSLAEKMQQGAERLLLRILSVDIFTRCQFQQCTVIGDELQCVADFVFFAVGEVDD